MWGAALCPRMFSSARRKRRSGARSRSCAPAGAPFPVRFQESYQHDCTPVDRCVLGYYKGCMPCRAVLALLALFLCACQPPEGSHSKAIIGAVLIDGTSGPPLSDSVVVVSDGRIRAVGRRSNVEIPSEADKIDGSARFLAPVVVDICESASPPGLIHPANPE